MSRNDWVYLLELRSERR